MAKEVIIDGYIGPYAYSKQYIRAMLEGSKGKETKVKISSLGGDLNHAINIHDQFVEHANIVVEFSSFSASSATIIALGAKTSKMNKNSFYLIHKVMSWIDEWGYMNEDDLEEIIAKLEKEKNENAKITLQIAKMYSDKSGKSVKDILDLMKKQTWLTAEEAKEWGFVDEITESATKVNYLEDYRMVAMIAGSGLPEPPRKHLTNTDMSKEEFVKDEKSFTAWFKDKFGLSPKKVNTEDEKDVKIAKLEETIKNLKAAKEEKPAGEKENSEETEKVEKGNETEKVEKSNESEKDNKIAELEETIKNLQGSAAADPDVSKTSDNGKTNEGESDFFSAVEEATKLNEMLEGIN